MVEGALFGGYLGQRIYTAFCRFYFLNRGSSIHSAVATKFYRKGPRETRSYSQTLTFYTKDLRKMTEKAIRSSSFSTASKHDTANLSAAGDITT
jgi:hypothetical protein